MASTVDARVVRLTRLAAVSALVVASCWGAAAPAEALAPPSIDPGALGAASELAAKGGPPEPTEQKSVCATPTLTGSPPRSVPPAQAMLDLPTAWQFSTGAGQRVAVVDTGVNRHPRLPGLEADGDFVSNSDGTMDCDGHGTLVAGLIAARPSPADAFVGVAPAAQILAIRQLSSAYQSTNGSSGNAPGKNSEGYGSVLTLAAAVLRAVQRGATVINISEVACTPTANKAVDGALGAAVKYAYDHNVVVVTAAGNLQQNGNCGTQNGVGGWNTVNTVVSPAWFAPYVLPVASVDDNGGPSEFTVFGPWVGVAAPGRNIVSLDSKPGGTGLVNSTPPSEGNGPGTIDGTSFSAGYVSGLAALVRARFPQLSAGQVMERIIRTAQAPGAGRDDRVGHGLIDPTAALTADLPPESDGSVASRPRAIAPPNSGARPDPWPERIALASSATLLFGLGIGYAISVPYRRGRREVIDPAELAETSEEG